MSLHEGAETSIKIDYEWSLKLWSRSGNSKDLCCHLFTVVIDGDTELKSMGVLNEMLYTVDIALLSEAIERYVIETETKIRI